MFYWHVPLKGAQRISQAAVAVGHEVYSFGGYCYGRSRRYINTHYVFNMVSLHWSKLAPATGTGAAAPSVSVGHTAVLIGDIIYIWGGLVNLEVEETGYMYTIWGDTCDALYAFGAGTRRWLEPPAVSGRAPEPRCDHSACVWGRAMYVFGGRQLTRHIDDIHKLDTVVMAWSLIDTRGGGTPATALSNHSATLIGTRMFVFGGQTGGEDRPAESDDVRVFDTETGRWLSTPPTARPIDPAKREGHLAFAHDGELYVLGGYDYLRNRNISDLWKFSPATFSWKKVRPPGGKALPCWRSGMRCCVAAGDRVVLFGGYYTRSLEDHLYVLELRPSLKTLCKAAVIEHGLKRSGLPYDVRWELAAIRPRSARRKKAKKGTTTTVKPAKRTGCTRSAPSLFKRNNVKSQSDGTEGRGKTRR